MSRRREGRDGEAVLFLARDDVQALTRGIGACVSAASSLPVDDPRAYTRAEVNLRVLLKVARRRLETAVGLERGFYLDPGAWPEETEVPVFVRRAEGEALDRAAAACRALATHAGPDPCRPGLDGVRRALLRLREAADAQLEAGEVGP